MTFIDQASDLLEGYISFGRFPIFNSQNEKKHRYRSKKKSPRVGPVTRGATIISELNESNSTIRTEVPSWLDRTTLADHP